jgi:hypothetical protein
MTLKSDPSQAGRFRAMAEELECDPDEAAFKAKLAVIAKAKVPEAPKAKKPSKSGDR